MINIFYIGIGGAFGAIARFILNEGISKLYVSTYPFAVLSINILGCFFIGLMLGLTSPIKDTSYYFFIVGFLGSFTTMSAFTHQTLMIANSNLIMASSYIILTVVLSIAATYFGATLSK